MIQQNQTVKDALEMLLQLHRLTESELARQTKIPQPTIHRLLTGATPDPRISTLKPLAKYFQITLGQLAGDEHLPTNIQISSTARFLIKVPIIPWHQACEWRKVISDYIPSNWLYWVTLSHPASNNSFALTITNKNLPAPFKYNSVVIVDPEATPCDGDYVLIYRLSDQSTTIKKIVFEGNDRWLMPLTEKISATPFNEDFNCCGVIAQINTPLITE